MVDLVDFLVQPLLIRNPPRLINTTIRATADRDKKGVFVLAVESRDMSG